MEFGVQKSKKRMSSGGTGETNGKEERWKMKDYGNCPRPISLNSSQLSKGSFSGDPAQTQAIHLPTLLPAPGI